MIFISHSSKDDKFVNDLRQGLLRFGFRVWVDHHDIPAGKPWDEVVDAALARSYAMILVLSPDAVESRNVRTEWFEFREQDKPILPVKIRDCVTPLLIRHLNYIDFTLGGRFEDKLVRIIKSLPDAGMGGGTVERPVQPSDIEQVRLRENFERVNRQIDLMLGEDQMLLALPEIKKSIMVDLDHRKLFLGCQIKWTDPKPDIDLTHYDGAALGVSRQHLMVERSREGVTITDLGSLNGTFINGRRLDPHKPFAVKNRTMLHIGQLVVAIFYRLSSHV